MLDIGAQVEVLPNPYDSWGYAKGVITRFASDRDGDHFEVEIGSTWVWFRFSRLRAI